MAGDPQIELRVARLENDTMAIYDLLGEVRSTQQEHSDRFDAMDQRFDSMDRRFDSMDQRFESIGSTLSEIVRRLPEPS